MIHSDFEKGFIRAETVAYADLVEAGSHKAAKEAGNVRAEGKEYVVEEGDVRPSARRLPGARTAARWPHARAPARVGTTAIAHAHLLLAPGLACTDLGAVRSPRSIQVLLFRFNV